jgi:predicted PurR-regulated permease PerM
MDTEQDKTGACPAEPNSSGARKFLRRPKADMFIAPAHGFIPVFVILVLFLLAAIFVKPLFFGILAAVLSFHFEQFLERRFFGTKVMLGLHAFLVKLKAPFTAFRKRITRRFGDEPEHASETEAECPLEQSNGLSEAENRRIATQASAMTVIFVVIVTVLLSWTIVHFISPFAAMSGDSLSQWAQNNHAVEKLEQKLGELLDRLDPPSKEEEGLNVRERMRSRITAAMEEHNADFAKYTLKAGNELVKNAFHITAWVGTFAFDLVMFLFFYYYFLLRMAVFAAGRADFGQNLGEWTVSSIYESGWLPDASEHERSGAAHIINHIYKMFRAWLVGYFWIIVLETILYALIFIPFNVPFWPVLSLIAGSTILLPFLGPVLAAILSVVVAIIFAQEGIVMPIIGIALAYLLIHVILEQLLLYPVLVGEAIGLTLVETIIVVLLGAVVAGISGMILAVPAAALLKLLVPLFYQTLNARRRRKAMQAQSSADSGTP